MARSKIFQRLSSLVLLLSCFSSIFASPAPVSSSVPVSSSSPLSNSTSSSTSNKKVIYWHQSLKGVGSELISLLPLIDNKPVAVTNLIIGSLHLNTTELVLNDDPLSSPTFNQLWSDVDKLREQNIKVHAMLQTNFSVLSSTSSSFETNYALLRDGLKGIGRFDGIDFDDEDSSAIDLQDLIQLIDRLRHDFGPDFLITLSPVASALSGGSNLSGFDYKSLEEQRGSDIAWYNTQFYSGFADASTPDAYNSIVQFGFAPAKVVMGLASSNASATGFVPLDVVKGTLRNLTTTYPDFAGVAGWEYFDSEPGGQSAPWQWSQTMGEFLSASNSTASNTKRNLHNMRLKGQRF